MDEYEYLKKIGEGSYGTVHKCRKSVNGEIVAIKTILFYDYEGVPRSVMRETNLLKQMDHPNIVKLLEVLTANNKVSLVLEYADYDLQKFILSDPANTRDPHFIKRLLHDILSGVQYCHRNRIIHRDLKLENLLINSQDKIVKLADFGLSRTIDTPLGPLTKQVGNLNHMAPEALLGSAQYSTPIDIWAVGCMFVEIVTHQDLFAGFSSSILLAKIARTIGTPDEQIWPGVTAMFPPNVMRQQFPPKDFAEIAPGLEPAGLNLLSRMLRWNPSERITATEALAHEYFDGIQPRT
ncbi:hypothetical protein ACET3Z_024606 [Daucus carota]